MTRKYEGLFILNTAGKEEGAKELVEKVEKEIQNGGGKINKVERMDKRPFARMPGSLDSGYYVNIVFNLDPEKLPALTNKFKLDEDIYRVMFLRPEESSKISKKSETVAA
jgi:small subunit ribosomal protein S6